MVIAELVIKMYFNINFSFTFNNFLTFKAATKLFSLVYESKLNLSYPPFKINQLMFGTKN